MRSRSFVSLLLVVSLMSLSMAQDTKLRVIRTVQDQPGEIVGESGVNYIYDPSNYATRSFGVYQAGTNQLFPWNGPEQNNANTDIWKIHEKDLGGWDISIPALLVTSNLNTTTLDWFTMTSKTQVPAKSEENTVTYDFTDEDLVCFDAVAISSTKVILDCANYDNDTLYLRGNTLYLIDLTDPTNLTTLITTPRKLENANTDCTRKIAYHSFGTQAWVYRWPSMSCAATIQTGIEIIDVSNWTAGNSTYFFDGDDFGKSGFQADIVSIVMGDIFVASTKDTYMARLTNFEGDYAQKSLSFFNIPDYPFAIKAFYDVILDASGVSVAVATKRTFYRIDWSESDYPFIVDSVAYGIGDAQELSKPTDLTSVWTSSNFYYISSDADAAVYSFLRKSHNVSITYGYYTYDTTGKSNATLTIPGVAKAFAADADQNYFLLYTDKATGSFYQTTVEQYFTGDTPDTNFTLITNIDDTPDPIFAYSQHLTAAGDGQVSGSFAYNYADAMIVSHNDTPVTWLLGIRTMADPLGYNESGLINSTTFRSRIENVAHNGPNDTLNFNYFLSNPYNWRNNFYWLTQDNNQNVAIQSCSVNENWQTHGLELDCIVITSAAINRTINQAAIGFDSEEQTISFIALGASDDGNIVFYDTNNFTILSTVTQTCQLESTRSHSASFVYCLNADNTITFWSTEIEGTFQSFTIDETALGLTTFAPLAISTSTRYPDLLFIQQANSIIIVTTRYAPDSFTVLTTLALPEVDVANKYTAVITEDQIVVVQSNQSISNYDLTNIRSPAVINRALPFKNAVKITVDTLTTSGSSLFVLNYGTDGQAGIFDSDLPDFRDYYTFNCTTVVGALGVNPDTELVFCLDNNTISIYQYFHVIRIQSVVNTPVDGEFVQTGAINIQFPNLDKQFQLSYDIWVPTVFQITPQPVDEKTLVVDLSTKDGPHAYAGDITHLFNGPLNGTFNIVTELDNETGVFTMDGPFYTNSYKLNFTPHEVASAVNFENTIYILSNEGQPTINEFDPITEQVVRSYQIILPNDDNAFYYCNHLLVFNHPTTNTTFVVACRYNVSGEVSLIYQPRAANYSLFTFPDLDLVAQARFNYTEDTLFVVGDRHGESYLFIYQINGTISEMYGAQAAPGTSQYAGLVPLVYNLNSFFGLEGREFGTFVDFEFVTGPQTTDGLPTIYFLFLQSNYGIRTAVFTAIAGGLIGYLEPYYDYRITHSSVFKNEHIPDLDWWSGIHIQDDSTFLNNSIINILLVQTYGHSYLVQFNLTAGFVSILQKFYPYGNNFNLGPAQFLDGKVTFATLHFGHPLFNISIVSYPFDPNNLNPANPTLPWGSFGSALPSLIWNDRNTDKSHVWTIDSNGNLNQINPSTSFTLKFVGSSTEIIHSKTVTITAFGGFNSFAQATFSVTLPIPVTPDNGTNVALIIILSILGIGLIVGGFFVFKKWKASKEDNYVNLPTDKKKIEE